MEAKGLGIELKKLHGPKTSILVRPRFTKVCRRRRDHSKLYFRCAFDYHSFDLGYCVADLLASQDFQFYLLWDCKELSWYDISNPNIAELSGLLDKECLHLKIPSWIDISSGSLDSSDTRPYTGYDRMIQLLKASGQKVECVRQLAQILQWPPLTPDELVDLEKILFSYGGQDPSSINDLAERMAFRLQGLNPDPSVSAPECTEWFVGKYAPDRCRPAHISKVE